MNPSISESDQKKLAAQKALEYIHSDTVIGLGSGSSAEAFITLLGGAFKAGDIKNIKVVSSSEKSAKLARQVGLDVLESQSVKTIDINVDGTDETEIKTGYTVKGGGNALHREKMIALKSTRNLFIAENKKAVAQLGAFGLPIEIGPFDTAGTLSRIQQRLPEKTEVALKQKDNALVYTDNQNLMAHITFHEQTMPNPPLLLKELKLIEGVFSVGLFINLADRLIIGKQSGKVEEFVFKV